MDRKKIYVLLHKTYWPYWFGAIIIGLLNVLLAWVYKPWGVTASMAHIGLKIWSYLGGHPEAHLAAYGKFSSDVFNDKLFLNEGMMMNFGLFSGVLLASVTGAEFKIRKIKNKSQLFRGIIGGLLMGYGSRLGLGCNVGAIIGGIASHSLHGWIFAIFSYLGALVGSMYFLYTYKKL